MIASRSEEKLSHATTELSKIGDIKMVKCNIREEEDVK
jgi:hypothetical protein